MSWRVVRALVFGAIGLMILVGLLKNPTFTSGITWPIAFLIAVIVVCATGLAGWIAYVRNRYTDEPED